MSRIRPSVRFSILPILVATVVAAIFAGAGYVRYAPPPLVESLDGDSTYSMDKIVATLELLVGDGIPHPAGSPQNVVVRQRIITFAESLGCVVELQETSGITWRTKETVPLVNVLIFVPGTEPKATIALTSHYDSTAAGPGAADDAAAVAISLELLRHYQTDPPRNNLLFLITDGEELGLLGAEKFVKEHPLAKTLDLVINLEARGTRGPSCMFETGDASRWTIENYAAVANRPTTSSLFLEIYRLLPNNTDFTHYRKLKIQGWNFAFIGRVLNYHTPNDNVQTVDRRSIQHHAEHAAGLMARFANAAELNIESGRVVYFDYLGVWIFMWDEQLAVPLAIVPTLFLLLGWTVCWRGGTLKPRRLVWASIWSLSLPLALVLGLWATFETMRFQDIFSPPWPKYPVPILLAFWITTMGISIALARVGCTLATEIFFCLAGCGLVLTWLTAFYVPGASYLFLLPTMGWGIASCWIRFDQRSAVLVAWLAVVALWFPLEPLFYDALGFRNREFLLGRLLLLNMAAAPICLVSWRLVTKADSEANG